MISPEDIAAHEAAIAKHEAAKADRAAREATFAQSAALGGIASAGGALAQVIEAALADLPRVSDREASFRGSISPRLEMMGFEARYRRDGLMKGEDPRIVSQREVLEKIRAKCRNVGAIIALVGNRGTGKTTIAAEAVAERLWAAHEIASNPDNRAPVPCPSCRYVKITDLVGKLKALYADFGTTQTDRLEAYRDYLVGVDLLILDEWQEASDDSKHKDKMTTDILDRRYSALRDTIIISNQLKTVFGKTINLSLADRIREHGGTIECTWASFRTGAGA